MSKKKNKKLKGTPFNIIKEVFGVNVESSRDWARLPDGFYVNLMAQIVYHVKRVPEIGVLHVAAYDSDVDAWNQVDGNILNEEQFLIQVVRPLHKIAEQLPDVRSMWDDELDQEEDDI